MSNNSIKRVAQRLIKQKGRSKDFPLIHKNFKGADNPYVWCKIIDIYDDYFMIELYGGTRIEINQIEFIDNYKEWEKSNLAMPYHD